MQCMSQLNLQLLKDQIHYSNVFISCYESFCEFYKKRNQETLERFLEQLECFTAIVKLWNDKYPGIEAQIKKDYNKEKIKKTISSCLNEFKGNNNQEIQYYFQKFLNLIEQKNENLSGAKNIYKNIHQKPMTMNAEEINNIGFKIQKKYHDVEQYVEDQKKNDFPDFDIKNNYNYNIY